MPELDYLNFTIVMVTVLLFQPLFDASKIRGNLESYFEQKRESFDAMKRQYFTQGRNIEEIMQGLAKWDGAGKIALWAGVVFAVNAIYFSYCSKLGNWTLITVIPIVYYQIGLRIVSCIYKRKIDKDHKTKSDDYENHLAQINCSKQSLYEQETEDNKS